MTVHSGPAAEPKVGNCLPMSKIPTGMAIHNLEMQPGGGGQALPVGGRRRHADRPRGDLGPDHAALGRGPAHPGGLPATIGMVGNPDHMNVRSARRAGTRWLGRRPHVRGVAMNPNNHPMGGGEGRTSGGRHPCSPTGKLAKGGKTRRRRKPSNSAIIRRRKSVRYGQLKV